MRTSVRNAIMYQAQFSESVIFLTKNTKH